MKLLCEQNPVQPTDTKGTLRKMTDQDRAELGLPPLVEKRGNRNKKFDRIIFDDVRGIWEPLFGKNQ